MVSTTFELPQPVAAPAFRSLLRFPAAALMLATAGTHVPIIGEHLREAPYIGVLFILLTVASTILAVLLVLHDNAWVWLATAGVGAASVLAYLLSRSVGLPQIGDDIGNWLDPLGIAAISVEALAAVVAVWVLRSRGALGRGRRRQVVGSRVRA